MKEFANALLHARLEVASAQMKRAMQTPDEEAVHDLRVSMRRLLQALKSFKRLYEPGYAKATRDKIRPILKAAGEVRNRDIAIELAHGAEIEEASPLIAALRSERELAALELKNALAAVEAL